MKPHQFSMILNRGTRNNNKPYETSPISLNQKHKILHNLTDFRNQNQEKDGVTQNLNQLDNRMSLFSYVPSPQQLNCTCLTTVV